MSDSRLIFQQYAYVVNTLRNHLAVQGLNLAADETLTQFVLSLQAPDASWLDHTMQELAPALLDARFRLSLEAKTYDFQTTVTFRIDSTVLLCDSDNVEERTDGAGIAPSPEEMQANLMLKEMLLSEAHGLSLADLCDAFDAIARSGGEVQLKLAIFLDKVALNNRLSADSATGVRLSSFLFPEAVLTYLENCTLARLENELWKDAKRVVIPVFGMSGLIQGDFVTICGLEHEDILDHLLGTPIDSSTELNNIRVLEFRRSEGIWPQPTNWLTPDVLDVSILDHRTASAHSIRVAEWFASQRALLSVLFLADNVDLQGSEFWVEYRGLGKSRFMIRPDQLPLIATCADGVFGLYTYSFEGLSPDKLAIAQQFLSLLATDVGVLCSKAADIRDATKKTYERTLVENVKDYFEARQKIQDRIRGAVDATSTSVMGLSREVGSDLYKIAGLILAAIIGTILEPEVTVWVGLAASSAIALYLVIVVAFHLPTMKRAQELSAKQNERYISSCSEILRDDEISAFMNDASLNEAQTLFNNRSRWATSIYVFFISVAILVAVFLIAQLLKQGTTLPTVFPSPTFLPSPITQP